MSRPVFTPKPSTGAVRRPLLALAGALALAIACGGGGDDGDAPSSGAGGLGAGGQAASCGPAGSAIGGIQRTGEKRYSAAPEMVIDPAKAYSARMKTDKGDFVIELAAKDVPRTVNNFVFLSCAGYFDGLTFHRLEPNFVIQGGDPRGDGTGGPGYRFADEFHPGWRHDGAGILSMANAGPNTNGSQFFITLAAAPHLDNKHSVFGKVSQGLAVVRNIRAGDRIISVSIEERST